MGLPVGVGPPRRPGPSWAHRRRCRSVLCATHHSDALRDALRRLAGDRVAVEYRWPATRVVGVGRLPGTAVGLVRWDGGPRRDRRRAARTPARSRRSDPSGRRGPAAVGPEAGPDPAPRQVEGDREADDEQAGEGAPDDPLARVALGDEERVVAEALEADAEVEGLDGGRRRRWSRSAGSRSGSGAVGVAGRSRRRAAPGASPCPSASRSRRSWRPSRGRGRPASRTAARRPHRSGAPGPTTGSSRPVARTSRCGAGPKPFWWKV